MVNKQKMRRKTLKNLSFISRWSTKNEYTIYMGQKDEDGYYAE